MLTTVTSGRKGEPESTAAASIRRRESHWWKVCWIYSNGSFLANEKRNQILSSKVLGTTSLRTTLTTTTTTISTTTVEEKLLDIDSSRGVGVGGHCPSEVAGKAGAEEAKDDQTVRIRRSLLPPPPPLLGHHHHHHHNQNQNHNEKSERRKEKKMDWSKYKTLADTFRTSDEHLLQTRDDYEMNLIRRELNNCRHFMIKTTDHLEGQVCALCLDQIPAQLLITLSTLSSSSSSNCAPNKVTISGSISSPATSPSSSSSSSSLLPSSSSPGSTRTPVIHFHSTCLKCFTCQESLLHQMILLYPSLTTQNNVQSHLQSQQHLHSHQLPQPGCPPLPQTPQPSRPTPEEPLLNPLLLVEPKFNPKTNRFYCLRHFLELFKPRCSYCDELIFEEECTEAENRVWHINHFICWECQRPLGGQQYVMKKPNEEEVKDEKPYCLLCFDLIFGQLCEECGEIINCSFGSIQYQGRHWHASDICFKCFHCSQSLLGKPFLPANDGQIYCSFNCSNQQQLKYIHNNNRSKSSHNESNHNHNKSNGHLNKSQSISDNSNSSSSCNKSDHIKSSSLNNGSTATTTNNTGSNSKSNSNNSNQLIVEEKRKNDEEKTIVNKVVVVNKVVEEEEKEDEMTRRNKKTMVDVMTMMMMMDKVEAGDVDVDKVEKRTKLIETGLNTGLTKDARNSAGNGGGHHHQHHHHHQEPDVVPQIKVMDTGESSNSGGSCSGSNNGVEIKDVELEEEEEELKKEIVTTKKVTFDPRILEKVSRKRHCNDDTCSMCSYSSTVSIGSTDSISSSSSSSSSSSLCSLDFGHLNGGQRLLHSSSTSTTLPSSFHPHHSSSSQLGPHPHPHPHPARHQSSSSSTLRHRNGETNISGVSGHQKYIRQQQTACYLM